MKINYERTAIKRDGPSLPMRFLVESGFIPTHARVFDYGHGKGDDMVYLRELGYKVDGWDIYHDPPQGFMGDDLTPGFAYNTLYDWVHLGYVLNILSAPDERTSVLSKIYEAIMPGVRLSVAVRTFDEVERSRTKKWRPLYDGWLTSSNTFQRGFFPFELVDMITAAGFDHVHIVKTQPLIAVASKKYDIY